MGKTATLANIGSVADGSLGFRNRIINGAMTFDQRNAGASVTPNNSYTLDRWLYENVQTGKVTIQQNAGSVTPPAGFTNYLGVTSTSAYSVLTGDTFLLTTRIEGYNVADLAFGTASASTITLSFWARSSLTGTFGGGFGNVSANRSYLFSYTINAANTWEYKTVTIAGDTSGTWNTTTGRGLSVTFGLGSGSTYSGTAGSWQAANLIQPTGSVSVVGTNGATFYITGVQLEKGSTATAFDYRPYGTELQLCQRYFESLSFIADSMSAVGQALNSTAATHVVYFQKKRATPTVTVSGPLVYLTATGANAGSATSAYKLNDTSVRMYDNTLSGLVAGNATTAYANGGTCTYSISAEL